MSKSYIIRCTSCGKNPGINMLQLDNSSGHIYSGHCSNLSCPQKETLTCRLCYMYENSQYCKTEKSGGGRPQGVFGSLKVARKHEKKCAKHQEALLLFENGFLINDDNNESSDMMEIDMTSIDIEIQNDDNESQDDDVDRTAGFDKDSKSPKYYKYENKSPGMGAKYLIGSAFELSENDYDKITTKEVNFFMNMALLLTQLTQQQQKLLADILLPAINSKDINLSIFKNTRCPNSMDDFEYLFLSRKTAIIPNLPVPVAKTTADGSHAYISLVDLLANEFASETTFDPFDAYTIDNDDDKSNEIMTTITKSDAAKKLYWELRADSNNEDEYIVYLWLKEWRDAFDPNNTKASRNQVWMSTFTISPPETDRTGKNTYFMSISGKSDDHSVLDQMYGTEITKLSTVGQCFYHGGKKKLIKVKLGKLITCVDRPERSSMFHVGEHCGSYSKYWGYAGSVDGFRKENNLASCALCRFKRLSNMERHQHEIEGTIMCTDNKCSGWNVLNDNFVFPAPEFYPTNYDNKQEAPNPPFGREVIIKITPKRERQPRQKKGEPKPPKPKKGDPKPPKPVAERINLKVIKMNIEWLKSACLFAYHNLRTTIPDSTKKYWNKQIANAYLRSCGISNSLINKVYEAATSKEATVLPTFPTTWYDNRALDKCHYAGMHMLFLGHVKSNFDMLSLWLSKRSLHTAWGGQANIYFEFLKRLRVTKYFTSHTLSTTAWGTGNWVSENYVFFARTQKFFFVLPALTNRKPKEPDDSDLFLKEYNVILRFVSASLAAFSRIMSTSKTVRDMDKFIKIYMDCMVEMDSDILKIVDPSNKKNKPNHVKSNALGIMSVATMHNEFGPLILNWEGGYAGERKIQDVKPLLGIKRENADWQRIALRRLYYLETIEKIVDNTKVLLSLPVSKGRDIEGVLNIFRNRAELDTALKQCHPLSAMLDIHNKVYVAYRPNDGTSSRSALSLIEINFDDKKGENVSGICWMSPINITNSNIIQKTSMWEVLEISKEFCLLLPHLCGKGIDYRNMYYAIGSNWTERTKDGTFEYSNLNVSNTFMDWAPTSITPATMDWFPEETDIVTDSIVI